MLPDKVIGYFMTSPGLLPFKTCSFSFNFCSISYVSINDAKSILKEHFVAFVNQQICCPDFSRDILWNMNDLIQIKNANTNATSKKMSPHCTLATN